MRKRTLGLIGAMTLVATILLAPSPASAEPVYQIWRCTQAMAPTMTISRTQYWSCPLGTIRVYESNTWNHIYTIDGLCANIMWNKDRSKTWLNAVWECSD